MYAIKYGFLVIITSVSVIFANSNDLEEIGIIEDSSGVYNNVESIETGSSIISDNLEKSIRVAKKLGGVGTFLHFTGLFLEGVGVSLLLYKYPERNTSFARSNAIFLIVVGSTLDLCSPIVSVIGTSRLRKTIKKEYGESSKRNISGMYYGISWVMEATSVGCTLVSIAVQRGNSSQYSTSSGNTGIGPIVFNILAVGFSIGGEVTRVISSVHPIAYAREIEQSNKITMAIVPVYQPDGSAGISCVFSF